MPQSLNAKLSEYLSVKDFGALGDGATDDTTAIHAAIAACFTAKKRLFFPAGTYRCNLVVQYRVSMFGEGMNFTQLRSYTAGGWAMSFLYAASNWRWDTIEKIGFIGSVAAGVTATDYGVRLGPATYTTNSEYIGRWEFRDCLFRAKVGVYLPYGNIGNKFTGCAFESGDFGIYGYSAATGYVMYCGCQLFADCHWNACVKAAVFINSLNGSDGGHVTFQHCVLEYNPGMAICIPSLPGNHVPSLAIENTWFEGNATGGSVTIDTSDPTGAGGTSFTPRDLYMGACDGHLTNCGFTSIELANHSFLVLDQSSTVSDGTSDIVTDDDSAYVILNGCSSGPILPTLHTETLGHYQREAGGYAPLVSTQPRVILTNAYTPVQSITFDGDAPTWSGPPNIAPTRVNDGIIFDSCAEYTFAESGAAVGSILSLTADKYAVISFDVKRVGSETGGALVSSYTSTMYATFTLPDDADRWFSFCGVMYTSASGKTDCAPLRMLTGAGETPTFRFSAFQVLEFDTLSEALIFVRARLYVLPAARPRVIYGSAAPTTGTWAVGDICWNTGVASAGYIGWVCTTGGAPGDWKTFGLVS